MAKKEMDNLTRDALAAQAAGMSYGKYKGLQHALGGQQQAAPAPTQSTRKTFDLVCLQCGGAFVAKSARKKYCCEDCKKQHDNEKWKETHPKNNKEE